MVGKHAGDMIGETALVIEMGADAVEIVKTIYLHLTLGESIGMAAGIAHGIVHGFAACAEVTQKKTNSSDDHQIRQWLPRM